MEKSFTSLLCHHVRWIFIFSNFQFLKISSLKLQLVKILINKHAYIQYHHSLCHPYCRSTCIDSKVKPKNISSADAKKHFLLFMHFVFCKNINIRNYSPIRKYKWNYIREISFKIVNFFCCLITSFASLQWIFFHIFGIFKKFFVKTTTVENF